MDDRIHPKLVRAAGRAFVHGSALGSSRAEQPRATTPLGRVSGKLGGELERPIVLDMDPALASSWPRRLASRVLDVITARTGWWQFAGRDRNVAVRRDRRVYGASFEMDGPSATLWLNLGRHNWRWEWHVWSVTRSK